MIQFGMPTLIENKTLEENAALCSSLGLKFIELNMNFPEYQVPKLEDTEHLIGTFSDYMYIYCPLDNKRINYCYAGTDTHDH